ALQLVQKHLTGEQMIDSAAGQQAVKALGLSLSQLLQQGLSGRGWDLSFDAALTAEIIRLPSYAYLIEQFDSVDIHAISEAIECLQISLSAQLKSVMVDCYQQLRQQLESLGEYQPLADHVALRSLKNTCLAFLLRSLDSSLLHLAETQFDLANNMTDQSSALSALVNCPLENAEAAAQQRVDRFYQQWSSESLVVNQWLTVQAASDKPGALGRVRALMDHEAYDNTNPNKVRALIAGFCMRNITQFHAQDGSGYELLSSEVIRLNTLNPQLASRLLSPLTQWQRFKTPQSELMQASLQRIADTENLSADVFEVVTKSLVAS
ncbi:MAG TPA: aminopeptidase N, partial [Cellvibrionales bacterium]|nr:aminopeptidase N [Cellvibrionales bacterium]